MRLTENLAKDRECGHNDDLYSRGEGHAEPGHESLGYVEEGGIGREMLNDEC